MNPSDEKIAVEALPLSEADEELYRFFRELEKESLKTLEEAARQIIGLVTTLLGLFFGVLAFSDNPAFLADGLIKALGTLSLAWLVAALFLALNVVMPRRLKAPEADLTQMRDLLKGLFERKSRFLSLAQTAFALGTLCLLGVTLKLLLGA